MHLTPLTTMMDNIQALAMERVKGVSDTNLLWTITKNIRSLECVSGRRGDPLGRSF